MNEQTQQQPTPAHIMQVGMGFWASKTLLTAVKFKLFTLLAGTKLSAAAIKKEYNLQTTDRHVYDWLDTLVSLGFLQRDGLLDEALYYNAVETDIFLDTKKPSYMGGILEMGNNRLYGFWNDLDEALKTGLPQNESKHATNMNFFEDLYKDENKLHEFMNAMSGIQTGNFMTLVRKFDFSKYNSLVDIGGADGWLSIQVALNHAAIKCSTYDLPPVEALAKKKIAQFNLSNRIEALSGDILKDTLPSAEVITMGNILHGFNEATKQAVIKKVYDSLPDNGVFIAIENVIDDERNKNVFGLLMSLNMLIENGDAFDYTPADFDKWIKAAGFKRIEIIPLTGPTSAAIAYK
jgi:hypothetical protein